MNLDGKGDRANTPNYSRRESRDFPRALCTPLNTNRHAGAVNKTRNLHEMSSESNNLLKSSTQQQEWVVRVLDLGIRCGDRKGMAQARKEEMAGLAVAVLQPTPEAMDDWDEKLLSNDLEITAPPLLKSLHATIRRFEENDISFADDDRWTEPTTGFFEAVFEGSKAVVSSSTFECSTAAEVLQILSLPELRKVTPDFVIGLDRMSIRVARNATSQPLRVDLRHYILWVKKRVPVLFESSNNLNASQYFSFFFGELKASGNYALSRIRNTTACYIALRMRFHLARLAKAADPISFIPPTKAMCRSYGLRALGDGVWTLTVMVASLEEIVPLSFNFKDQDGSDQQEPECSEGDPDAESVEKSLGDVSLSELDFKSYTISNLWIGCVYDPVSLLGLVRILLKIRDQIPERCEQVGNWLYCLRSYYQPESFVNEPKGKRKATQSDIDERPSKRVNNEDDFNENLHRLPHIDHDTFANLGCGY